MDVFFLFPGRVWIVFYLSLGSQQTKNPTGQKCFVYFGTFRGDTEFWFRVSILFLTVFSGMIPRSPLGMRNEVLRGSGRAAILARRCFAICVENSVPVSLGAWHAQVWVKVLAR